MYTTAYPDGVQKPKILFAGHSFGSRILTAMSQANTWAPMVDQLQTRFHHIIDPTRLPTNYTFQTAISGALYVQSALGEVDLKRKRTYAVVIPRRGTII